MSRQETLARRSSHPNQLFGELGETIVEVVVINGTVVAEGKCPDQRVLRSLEEFDVGDSRLARIEDDEFSSVALESFEVEQKVVSLRVELDDCQGMVHRDVVDGGVASVEALDQSPGRRALAAVEVALADGLDLLVARKLWPALLTTSVPVPWCAQETLFNGHFRSGLGGRLAISWPAFEHP